MSQQIRVALVEDQLVTREGLSLLIDGSPGFEICGQYASMELALEQIHGNSPGVLLADIGLPGMSGIEGVRRIHDFWGLFIYKPPVTRVGAEKINGFDTIKYVVDTTHQSQMEKSAGLLGLKDYNITGTAWVLKDAGCVLQYKIDEERVDNSGKISKTRFEGTIAKR